MTAVRGPSMAIGQPSPPGGRPWTRRSPGADHRRPDAQRPQALDRGVHRHALGDAAEIDADSRRQRDRASFGVELDPPPATTWRHGTGRGGHVDPRPAGISVQPRQLAVGPETAQPPLPLREKPPHLVAGLLDSRGLGDHGDRRPHGRELPPPHRGGNHQLGLVRRHRTARAGWTPNRRPRTRSRHPGDRRTRRPGRGSVRAPDRPRPTRRARKWPAAPPPPSHHQRADSKFGQAEAHAGNV